MPTTTYSIVSQDPTSPLSLPLLPTNHPYSPLSPPYSPSPHPYSSIPTPPPPKQNDDITPAAFWVTNANNTLIGNHAAGGTHFGFWYRMHSHPDGPSADSSYCPRKVILFINLFLLHFTTLFTAFLLHFYFFLYHFPPFLIFLNYQFFKPPLTLNPCLNPKCLSCNRLL